MNDSYKYFFEKSIELLHRKTFDSFRVNLHNPASIFDELNKSILRFNKKRIKHFDPTITSIIDEALVLIKDNDLNLVFSFGSFTQKQLIDLMKGCRDGKRNKTLSLISKSLCYENKNFKDQLLICLKDILVENNELKFELIDKYSSWLITQLLFHGFSRRYIVDQLKYCNQLIKNGRDIDSALSVMISGFEKKAEEYSVLFKIKCNLNQDLKLTSHQISFEDEFPSAYKGKNFISERFQEKTEDEHYLMINIESLDFRCSLNKALQIISETIELNILHDSDNQIVLEKQALVVHPSTMLYRFFPVAEDLDGFYQYHEKEFYRFIDNFKMLKDESVAREKIKSAIRFYKLGNEAIEVEHKILNYWIGFEQLFSSVDTEEDSIKRIKIFFVAINGVFYWQRKTNYILNAIERAGKTISLSDLIPGNVNRCDELSTLIKSRYRNYISIFSNGSRMKSLLEQHMNRMEQHLTRIYRVRNELVHEGRSTVDLFLLAGHLRHFLLFSIEQLTNELSENPTLDQLDDVFVYFETLLTRIKTAENIQEIFDIKMFKGYME